MQITQFQRNSVQADSCLLDPVIRMSRKTPKSPHRINSHILKFPCLINNKQLFLMTFCLHFGLENSNLKNKTILYQISHQLVNHFNFKCQDNWIIHNYQATIHNVSRSYITITKNEQWIKLTIKYSRQSLQGCT